MKTGFREAGMDFWTGKLSKRIHRYSARVISGVRSQRCRKDAAEKIWLGRKEFDITFIS